MKSEEEVNTQTRHRNTRMDPPTAVTRWGLNSCWSDCYLIRHSMYNLLLYIYPSILCLLFVCVCLCVLFVLCMYLCVCVCVYVWEGACLRHRKESGHTTLGRKLSTVWNYFLNATKDRSIFTLFFVCIFFTSLLSKHLPQVLSLKCLWWPREPRQSQKCSRRLWRNSIGKGGETSSDSDKW